VPAPPAQTPPDCFRCGRPSRRFITRETNRKKNAGLPYDKCKRCWKFLGFADEQGNDPNNPPCCCGVSSKRQVAGPEKRVPHGLHYVCRLGTCDFYAPCKDGKDRHLAVDGELAGRFG
ncbi:hypothetical protein K458DRAFT_293711, partial [Lentithecium fluviatile CBS 122367]